MEKNDVIPGINPRQSDWNNFETNLRYFARHFDLYTFSKYRCLVLLRLMDSWNELDQ
jgi:hypothetical protein